MKCKPVLDMVVLEKKAPESKEEYFDVNEDKNASFQGVILAIGNRMSEKSVVKVGMTFVYRKGAGTDTVLEGKEVKIMRESDLLVGW